MMSPELFESMVTAWLEVYAPILQATLIGAVVLAVLIGVAVFIALLLRAYLTGSVRLPS